ncbi:MAG: type II secretion system protein [Planctomycetota bacterium]
MSRRRKCFAAFTLVELLVVLAITVLLITMLLPMFGKAKEAARLAQCAANLNSLGVAYTNRGADIAGSGAGTSRPVVGEPYAWPSLLGQYLGGDGGVLSCPSDEQLDPLWDGKNPSAEGFDDFVSAPGYEWMLFHHVDGVRTAFHVPMTNEHPLFATIGWDGTGRQVDQKRKDRYGSKPDQALVFTTLRIRNWLKFDQDAGSSYDGGSGWGHEHQFSFVPVEKSEDSAVVEGIGWKVQHGEKWLYNGKEGDDAIKKNYTYAHTNEWVPASYGMNNRAPHLARGERRILLVDYERLVADVVDADDHAATDSWTHEMDEVRGRHGGRVNVLWSDGSVTTKLPGEIDPGISENLEQKWRPRAESN